jgi:hypothetical protein
MESILALIGGLGIGSLLTKIVDYYLNRNTSKRTRLYEEKREAYLGLLDSLSKAAISPSDENSKLFALWQTRVEIFGSKEAAIAVQGIIDTNNGPKADRERYFHSLIQAIREDLGSNPF